MIKMSPNSLFAVLLRSPWWVGVGIALTLALVCRALLPAHLWLVGAMGGLPFLGISLVVLWRGRHALSPRRQEAILTQVAAMAWPEFSAALKAAFERDGYAVAPGEAPADMVITRAGRNVLVSARRWKAAQQGEDALRLLLRARDAREASGVLVVSLHPFTPQAFKVAAAEKVQHLQGSALATLLKDMHAAS
jgi:restriction system protein